MQMKTSSRTQVMRKDCFYFEGVYQHPTPDYRNHFTKKAADDDDRTKKHLTKVELNIDSRFRFHQKS